MLVESSKVVAGGHPWVELTEGQEILLAVNEAHAAGLQAAGFSQSSENIDGQVRLGLRTENQQLVSTLLQMGWDETDNGAEWWVELPDGHRMSRDFNACQAYADAFKHRMRELLPGMGMFEVLSQSSTY